ncbi:MAG: M48 family metallopeptidase [Bacteroidetes bacterium]|nr:M48 family metallopeptidase [Bacteroidota bacterium]
MKKKIQLIVATFLILISSKSLAQLERNYCPSPFMYVIPEHAQQKVKEALASSKREFAHKKNSSFSYLLLKKHSQSLLEFYTKGLMITDGLLQKYLQEIVEKIIEKNPTLTKRYEIYPYRSDEPNATAFWDGTIGVSLGLLCRLKTEDQLAFVICHELAHISSEHVLHRIDDLTKFNFDKELKKEIKSAEKSEFLKYSKLTRILMNLDKSLKRHIRAEEFVADSLGLTYFLNTNYQPREAIKALEVLDSANTPFGSQTINLKKVFETKAFPFNEKWLEFDDQKVRIIKEVADSVLTHPDCKHRIEVINRILGTKAIKQSSIDNQPKQNRVLLSSRYELAESLFQFKEYGKSLFISILLASEFPSNPYGVGMVGRNMAYISKSMREFTFGKSVQLMNPIYGEQYNRFLSFLHRLRANEAASLAFNYLIDKKDDFYSDENFLFSFWAACSTPASTLSPQEIKSDYLKFFPNGRFSSIISNNF